MKGAKKEEVKLNKRIFVVLGIILLFVVCSLVINIFEKFGVNSNTEEPGAGGITGKQIQTANYEGNSNNETQVETYYLSNEQINILNQTILSSAFVKDIPDKGIVALRFYDFIGEQRIWIKDTLICSEGFINEGTSDMTLIMHAKYISQLNGTNLCDVVKSAQTNGEMWVESEENNAKLFLKYSNMMKYKECLGL